MRENSEDFIQKLKDSDDYSWNNLVRSYRYKLFAYAYSLSKDNEMSLEIVQQVFVKIYIVRKRLNPTLSFKAYMYKSVYNEFINTLNKKKKIYRLHMTIILIKFMIAKSIQQMNLKLKKLS